MSREEIEIILKTWDKLWDAMRKAVDALSKAFDAVRELLDADTPPRRVYRLCRALRIDYKLVFDARKWVYHHCRDNC